MDKIIKKATTLWQNDNELAAIRLIEKSEIAETGPAYTLLGKMYTNAAYNSNIKRDYEKARHYFLKAAELEDAEAYSELASLYRWGYGVQTNMDETANYWKKAYDHGDVTAGFELANHYAEDKHDKIEVAIKIYKDLISKKEFMGNVHYSLSKIYGLGKGVKADPELQLKYLHEGATQKGFNCCMDLALIYYEGIRVEKNKKKALEIAKSADTIELFDAEKQTMIDMIENDKIE